ncbi:MAG: YbdD/YjiX family protein [Gallionella sp.]
MGTRLRFRVTPIKSVRGECFTFAPLDTPHCVRHSGRTGNVSNHSFGLNRRFLSSILISFWRTLRQLSGDDGYERYLYHHAAAHSGTAPLSRSAWFARQEQQRWSSINRCC